MVIGIIARAGYIAAKYTAKYIRQENKLFNYAYKGYPRSVRYGARHGSILGTIAGTFIQSPQEEFDNGFSQPRNGPSAYQQYKKRSGQFRTYTGRNQYKYSSTCFWRFR